MATFTTHGLLSMSFKDAAKKSSNQRLHMVVITAGNFAAQQTASDTLEGDTEAMSDGVIMSYSHGNENVNISPTYPTGDVFRSKKIAVTYQDQVTGRIYTTQIPIRKAGLTYLPNTKLLDLSVTPTSTYVADFNSFAQSIDKNAVAILEMRAVGRDV
jgi:hypothetical protein